MNHNKIRKFLSTNIFIVLVMSIAAGVYGQDSGSTPPASVKNEAARKSPSQVITKSDWINDPPSSIGWRKVSWGMSPDEVINALPGDVKSKKDKDSDSKIKILAKFQKKARYDELDYDVEFGFDKSNKFTYLRFVCKKAKKESFDNVVNSFIELFGKPDKTGDETYLNGDAIWASWDKEDISIGVSSSFARMNAFMTFRDIIVIVHLPSTFK